MNDILFERQVNQTQMPSFQRSAMVRYNIIGLQYAVNTNVEVDPKCNGWTAINRGTKPVQINGITLQAPPSAGLSGESVTIGGNFAEIYDGRIELIFDPTDTAPSLMIIMKNYL